MIVIDVKSNPHQAGAADVPGNAIDITTAGGYAYVALGDSGLAVLDLAIAEAPRLVGRIDTPGRAQDVIVDGSRAYVAAGHAGIEIIDVSNPQSPVLIGSADTHFIATKVAVVGDILGVADNYGLTIIDVSNPSAPELIGQGLTVGPARAVAMDGRFAYVAQGAPGGLEIFDLADPAVPVRMCNIQLPSLGNAVVLQDSLAFCVDGPITGGFHIIDVTPPAPAPPVGSISIPSGRAVGVIGHQAVAGTSELLLSVDMSVIDAPVVSGSAPLSLPATDIAISGPYAVVSCGGFIVPRGAQDAGAGELRIFDIRNPGVLVPIGGVGMSSYTGGVEFDGTFAYVADAVAGLVVVDLTDPPHPQLVGGYDPLGFSYDVAVSDRLAVLIGEGHPLAVLDVSNPTAPQLKGTVNLSGQAVAISGDLACVAGGELHTVDLSDPEHPGILGSAQLPSGTALDIAIANEIAYVAGEGFGVLAFDLTNPESPHLIGGIPVAYGGYAVAVDEHWVYAIGELDLEIHPHQCGHLDPVDLGGLEAMAVTEGIHLRWESHPNLFTEFWIDRALGIEPAADDYVVLNPMHAVPGHGPWEFLDRSVSSGQSYSYKIRGERRDGAEETIGPVVATANLSPTPRLTRLRAAPNPSANEVTLHFELRSRSAVEVEIYDATGHLVRRLYTNLREAGLQTMIWDGRNGGGQRVASGRYVAKVSLSGVTESTGIVLLRH